LKGRGFRRADIEQLKSRALVPEGKTLRGAAKKQFLGACQAKTADTGKLFVATNNSLLHLICM
jgi:hypothetical protein